MHARAFTAQLMRRNNRGFIIDGHVTSPGPCHAVRDPSMFYDYNKGNRDCGGLHKALFCVCKVLFFSRAESVEKFFSALRNMRVCIRNIGACPLARFASDNAI